MIDFKNNPDEIRRLSSENQTEWLRGYIDANLTVDAKGFSKPTSIIRDGNVEKLDIARDILTEHGMSSEIKVPKTKNPYLKITGLENHLGIKDRIKPERPSVNVKLDNLSRHPERFEKTDLQEYIDARAKCGSEFERQIGNIKPIIRPETEKYEFKNPVETGYKIEPDFVVKHPDGKVEAIEVKLHYGRFEKKDKDYLKHSEIDYMSLYLLEGDERPDEQHHGKDVYIRNFDNLINELNDGKDKLESKGEKDQVDKLISDLESLRFEAGNLKKDSSSSNLDVIVIPGTTIELPDKPDEPEEEEGGNGKEGKQPVPNESQEGDHIRQSDSEKKMLKK